MKRPPVLAILLVLLACGDVLARGGGGCVESGTPVLTPGGWTPVEALVPGDAVVTVSDGRVATGRVVSCVAVEPAEFVELVVGGRTLRLTGEHTRLVFPDGTDETSYQAVLTGLYDITCEKSVAARAIWRSGGFSAYAAYRQVVRRGMDAYIILGDPNPELTGFTHRVVFKLIWAF